MVIKLDFSKTYGKVNWLFLRLILIHIDFGLPLIY